MLRGSATGNCSHEGRGSCNSELRECQPGEPVRNRGEPACTAGPLGDQPAGTSLCVVPSHVDDRIAAIGELRRVLKTGGRCVAVTNSDQCHRELVELMEGVVGHGWRLRRPADVRFGLENGADQLRAGFGRVERVDAPFGAVRVSNDAALADYIASMGDHYEAEVAPWMTWDAVVAECRNRGSRVIATEGHFEISSRVGAFVCCDERRRRVSMLGVGDVRESGERRVRTSAQRIPTGQSRATCDTGVHVAETPWVEGVGRSCSAGRACNAVASLGGSRDDRCL